MQEPFFGQSILGILLITGLAWLSSSDRRRFNVKVLLIAIALQFGLAFVLLKVAFIKDALLMLNALVLIIEEATGAGTAMVFGFLGGAEAPYDVSNPANSFILAFRALPIVIVFSALCAVLWHWRITPMLIKGFSTLLERSLGIGGAVGLGSASSIFVGMVESPLVVRPYLKSMSRSELFILMTCGMATVAGTVMGLYAAILSAVLPQALSHIVIASLISAPAAIALAMVMRPEDSDLPTQSLASADVSSRYASTMQAITEGTHDGLKLFLNIVAMLIVFVALVSIVNQLLGLIPSGGEALTLQSMLAWLLRPLMWSLGIPWGETLVAGQLMATKVILNELLAFLQLSQLPAQALSEHSRVIVTYALCGFANFGSLGIMIGGLTTICPERSRDIIALAPWSIWSGMLSTCMTGAIIALIA